MKVRNPKTGRILKNPERFIERLQADLADQDWRISQLNSQNHRASGEEIVNWVEYTRTQKAPESTALFSFRPGDKIAIVGRIISVKGSKCSAGNKESEIEYTVLQTRRMPEDW